MQIKRELVDRHLKLFRDDWDFLMEYTGPHSAVGLSPGEVVRAIVHQKVKWLRAKAIERVDQEGPGEATANKEIARLLAVDGKGESKDSSSADELGF